MTISSQKFFVSIMQCFVFLFFLQICIVFRSLLNDIELPEVVLFLGCVNVDTIKKKYNLVRQNTKVCKNMCSLLY